ARNLSAALHHGHLHSNSLRESRAPRESARWNRLHGSGRFDDLDHRGAASVIGVVPLVCFDSLGEKLNNPLPRLSRLERFYGERETGPRLRHARHVDLESASARSATRSWDRGPDPADVERYFARRARFALPGALPT